MTRDMTFLEEIEREAQEIKKQLGYRQLVLGDAPASRDVQQVSSVAGVDIQKTDIEEATPPRRMTTISPVEYQEP